MSYALQSARVNQAELIFSFDEYEFDAFYKTLKKLHQQFGPVYIAVSADNHIQFTCGYGEAEVKMKINFFEENKNLPHMILNLNKNMLYSIEDMTVNNTVDILLHQKNRIIEFTDYHHNPVSFEYDNCDQCEKNWIDIFSVQSQVDTISINNLSRLLKPFKKSKWINLTTFENNILCLQDNIGKQRLIDPSDKEMMNDNCCEAYKSHWLHRLWGKEATFGIYSLDNYKYLSGEIQMPMNIECEFIERIK